MAACQATRSCIHKYIFHALLAWLLVRWTKQALQIHLTWLLKDCIDELLPSITRIVNSSLQSGIFPSSYKLARVTPLIKKVGKDPEDLNNYRSISNLKFLSKVVQRVAMSQLQDYMQENGLYGKVQSAYRKNYSTEVHSCLSTMMFFVLLTVIRRFY